MARSSTAPAARSTARAISRDTHPHVPAVEGSAVEAPLAKGTNFLHVKAYVIRRISPEAWAALLLTLAPPDREVLGSVVSIGWYPAEAGVRLIRAAEAMFGGAGSSFATELGRFSAEEDLSGIQRMFLRLANPILILEKSRDYWSRFQNTGRWTVERHGPHRATGTLLGWSVVEPAACAHLEAYIVRMFELVGAPRVRFEHVKCRCRGDEACAFSGEWK